MCPISYIIFQGINRNNRLIVVKERIVVCWQLRTDLVNFIGIETYQRNGEAIPHFLLELRHHGFPCHDQNTLALAAQNELAHQDACFQCLTKTNGIGNQDTLTRLFQSCLRRHQLIRQRVHRCTLPNMNLRVRRDLLPPLTLQIKKSIAIMR